MAHIYVAVENLALTAPQRNTLVAHLRALGPTSHPQPCMLNHARIRADQQAMICEADFQADTITITAVKQRLASIFGVAVSLVTHTLVQSAYGPVYTIKYGGQNKLRFLLFGGATASWAESNAACRAYIAANAAEWEGEG